MQIGELTKTLDSFEVHKPSLPAPRSTPPPERNKVVRAPVRVPVNKQAALIIRPVRCWVHQPPPMPPEKLETPETREIARLAAELKAERNAHAETRDALGRSRQEVAPLERALEQAGAEIQRLRLTIQKHEATIRQLEDIKL